MGKIMFGLLMTGAIFAFADETVKLSVAYDDDTCITVKNEILENLERSGVDGRYTVISKTLYTPEKYPCGCDLFVTLQDSNFELSKRHEKTKKTLQRSIRNEELAVLEEKVMKREGYIWHGIDYTTTGIFWNGYSVDSLYLKNRN